MSRGLKSYYTYEEMELETAGKLSFNIAYGIVQYFFTIPLLTTRGSNPITLSAVYANENYSKSYGGKFILGDKCNLNLPPKITKYDSDKRIITLLADGSEEEYSFENDVYKNPITKSTITKEDNQYILTNTDGDKLYYKGLNVFPYEIILANHTRYTITEKENIIEYANTLGCVVEIISSGEYVERINYTENE
ncbi:MAG: hypothetical protein K2O23_02840, partial [Anaeroplasmataceae bacterium]|nr:hypothetical protein [Anaeroplasmataceae bacterium]